MAIDKGLQLGPSRRYLHPISQSASVGPRVGSTPRELKDCRRLVFHRPWRNVRRAFAAPLEVEQAKLCVPEGIWNFAVPSFAHGALGLPSTMTLAPCGAFFTRIVTASGIASSGIDTSMFLPATVTFWSDCLESVLLHMNRMR